MPGETTRFLRHWRLRGLSILRNEKKPYPKKRMLLPVTGGCYSASPMAKTLVSFREGDRSEYLAQSVFSTIGFVAAVARQEDRFLTDLLVQLNDDSVSTTPDVLRPTGACVAVQVKSNYEPITDTRDPTVAALVAAFSQLPWFVAVAEKRSGKISVYSTVQRHFWRNVTGFTIALESPPQNKTQYRPKTIYVGPPIASVCLSDLDSVDMIKQKTARTNFRQALLSWAQLDATNIAYRSLGIPAIVLPQESWRGGVFRDEDTQLHFITGQVNPEEVTRSAALAVQTARICLQRVGVEGSSARTRTIAVREMKELSAMLSSSSLLPDLLSYPLPLATPEPN